MSRHHRAVTASKSSKKCDAHAKLFLCLLNPKNHLLKPIIFLDVRVTSFPIVRLKPWAIRNIACGHRGIFGHGLFSPPETWDST